jgi:DNA-binding transcriptional ArsR family regulator
MSDDKDPLDLVFMALADKTRRVMIHRLAGKSMAISELTQGLEMSLAAASKHIKVLEKAKIVQRRIEGRTHTISLIPERLGIALDWVSIYRNFWSSRMDALAESLEKNK